MRKPAKIMSNIAKFLDDNDQVGFENYLDKLNEDEMKKVLQYANGIQALMMDGLARKEQEKNIVVPDSKIVLVN